MNTNIRSVKFNFIMNVILTMSTFIFPLITFRYVSRILLPAGTGKVSFATSLVTYFNMFAQLGIPTYGIRACAKVRDNREELTRTAHELLFINLAMGLISYIALIAMVLWIPRLQEDRALYVVVSFTILLSAIGMEWLYKGLEQYAYITVRSVIFKIIALGAMFLLIHAQKDYVIYGGITIFASGASNILNFITAKRFIDWKPVGGYNLKRHLRAIAVFFSMSCATTVYTNLDTVMLGFMTTDQEVGFYNAAMNIKSILVTMVTSLGAVLLPRCTYYVEHRMMREFRRVCGKALNFVVITASSLAVYFTIFAGEGILFLSGPAYQNSVLPMQIIMPALLFIGLTNIMGLQILVPLGREHIVLLSVTAGAVIDLALNMLLIPVFGASGAAVGTVTAELAVLVIQYSALKKQISGILRRIHYMKIFQALVLGSAACFWVRYLNLGSFAKLVVSSVLFFSVYGVFLLVSGEPLAEEARRLVAAKLRR